MLPRIEMYPFQNIMNRVLVKQYSRQIFMTFAGAKFKYLYKYIYLFMYMYIFIEIIAGLRSC